MMHDKGYESRLAVPAGPICWVVVVIGVDGIGRGVCHVPGILHKLNVQLALLHKDVLLVVCCALLVYPVPHLHEQRTVGFFPPYYSRVASLRCTHS